MHIRRSLLVAACAALCCPLFAQQTYFKASNTEALDAFGRSALHGDRLVVGAPYEASDSPGVNGDQLNNNLYDAGAAYVFVHDGTSWSQEAYLKADVPGHSDHFGYNVAIEGDTIAVGAPGRGAVYVFRRLGGMWTQIALLEGQVVTGFGDHLEISGSRIVVSGTREWDPAVSALVGVVYVFLEGPNGWSLDARLTASNGEALDRFGGWVAIDGDRIAVGAHGEDGPTNSIHAGGAVYIYERSGGQWTETNILRLHNPDVGEYFGSAVFLEGDRLLVSVPYEDSAGEGVNSGMEGDNSMPDSGAGYLYEFDGAAWQQTAFFKAPHNVPGHRFGMAGLSGDLVVGYSSQPFDGYDSRCAICFHRDGNSYEIGPTLCTSPHNDGFFSAFVSDCDDDRVIMASYNDASNATGVNGDPYDTSANYSGAVYLFENLDENCRCPHEFCVFSGAGAKMGIQGTASISANSLTLTVSDAPAGQFGLFFSGALSPDANVGNGVLCLGGPLRRLPVVQADATGFASYDLDLHNLPGGVVAEVGEAMNFQFWHRSPGGGFDFSTGLSVIFCP